MRELLLDTSAVLFWTLALANQRDCPLVTSDERIRVFHKSTIW